MFGLRERRGQQSSDHGAAGGGAYSNYYSTSPQGSASSGLSYEHMVECGGSPTSVASNTYHNQLSGDESKNRRRRGKSLVPPSLGKIHILAVLSVTTLAFSASTLHYRGKYNASTLTQISLERTLRDRKKHAVHLEERVVEIAKEKKKLRQDLDEARHEGRKLENALQKAERATRSTEEQPEIEADGQPHRWFPHLPDHSKMAGAYADLAHAPEIEADENHHPYWFGLSPYSKMAATILGFNRWTWDDEELTPIFDKALHELTDEQRSASSLLWLDDYFEHDDAHQPKVGDEVEKDPTHHPYWNDLSQYSKMAATVLGYNRTTWDADTTTLPIFDKTLEELTNEEREASSFLWIDKLFKSAQHAPEIEADEKHRPLWGGLSDYSKMAAIVLGYNKKSWDNNIPLSIFEKTLHELTEEERSASTLLWLDGLFKQGDDATDLHDLPKAGDEIERDPLHHPYWDGLSEYSRMAATVVGYNQTTWDTDTTTMPIFEKSLSELTDEEREASSFLWLDKFFNPKEGLAAHAH